jgi:N utilization substance protein A
VYVAEDQLSLAIGRGGQNVRLAAKLTGWKIDVRSQSKPEEAVEGGTSQSAAEGGIADFGSEDEVAAVAPEADSPGAGKDAAGVESPEKSE